MKTPSCFVFSCFLLMAAPGEVRPQDNAPWQERFRKEAPRRWQEYLERGKRLQGSRLSTGTRNDQEGKVYARSRVELKQNENCALALTQNLLGENQTGELNAVNSRYGFRLRRSAPDKPWAIAGQDLNLEDGYGLALISPNEAVRNWVGSHLFIDGVAHAYLPDAIKDPDFSVRSAAPVVRDRRTLVRVEFSARPKPWTTRGHPNNTDWMPLRGGWIVFDPERYWVVRECHLQLQFGPGAGGSAVSMDGKFEYKEGREGFPIAKRAVRRWSNGTQYTEEFDLVEREDVPESEFTLSAFGLPEPHWARTKKSP
jgi:hypothetical protein